MPKAISISDLRPRISEIFTAVVHGHAPAFVQRGGRDIGMLLGIDELERLVSAHSFHPGVLFEQESVSIWLPEFALYGRGASYVEAQEDLVVEVRDFVDDFFEDAQNYLRAPNREGQFAHALRAAVADYRGDLREVLFAQPDETSRESVVTDEARTAERVAPFLGARPATPPSDD